jgi:hypothetical protein
MLNSYKFFRYYHYGFEKPDNVDEIGQPIEEDDELNSVNQDDSTLVEDTCEVPQFFDQDLPLSGDDEIIEEKLPTNEGTQEIIEQTETLPQIETANSHHLPMVEEKPILNQTDTLLHLNIFDQTTILKLFSAKNWTETFFNRVFRKKFLVLSPDDCNNRLEFLKDGRLSIDEQFLHMTHKIPAYDFLPAIDTHIDGMIFRMHYCSLNVSRLEESNNIF